LGFEESLPVEKLPQPQDGKIIFDKVLLVSDDKGVKIGSPYIDGASIAADFVEEGRAKKITVIHYKAKVRYKKTYGHRQPFTKVKVVKIA